ncbi:MAG: exosome complex RNA-binding protein Rrp4 [Candidatus Pacearchaeota archaeon]
MTPKKEKSEEKEEEMEVTGNEHKEDKKRFVVIPGEIIISGKEYLPGEGTRKENDNIISERFGLAEISDRLVRIIPLSGAYIPRVGNIVIGRVSDINFAGWVMDIKSLYLGFLPLKEYTTRYKDENDLEEIYEIGDLVACKITEVKRKSVTLTTRLRGLGKLEEGLVITINSNKVPRVIGREGSMINLIKKETNCNIIVGQNGVIWIRGNSVEDEIKAKSAILFIAEKPFIDGLTSEVEKFLKEYKIKE